MSSANCACGRPARDATLCPTCCRRLHLALLSAAAIAPDLDTALARQARFTEHAGRGAAGELPWDERAAEAAWILTSTLTGWAQALEPPRNRAWNDCIAPAGAKPAHLPADRHRGSQGRGMHAIAWHLLRHGRVLAARHDAADALDEISAAVRQARHAVDRPPQRAYAGPCPDCDADLLTWPGRTAVTCRGCGATHDVAERQAWMRSAAEDQLRDASTAAALVTAMGCPVRPGTVRSWASRGKLAARPGGLYRIGDVLDRALAARG